MIPCEGSKAQFSLAGHRFDDFSIEELTVIHDALAVHYLRQTAKYEEANAHGRIGAEIPREKFGIDITSNLQEEVFASCLRVTGAI